MNEAALSITTQENRDEIESQIQDMKSRNPSLTYSHCRNEVRRLQPGLFGLSPVIANRATRAPNLQEVRDDEAIARRVADAIRQYRIQNRDATYLSAREALRREKPELFDPQS